MNDKLLLRKRVNISNIEFLQFLHPNFDFVKDLDEYDNPFPDGIIYIGNSINNLTDRLNTITSNWIIVNNHIYDIDLSTNEGLLKYLLPLQYNKLNKPSKDNNYMYKHISYDALLDKIKKCLIDGSQLSFDDDTQQSMYNLFKSILLPVNDFASVYFNIITKENINLATSSILSFLNKVQYKILPKDNIYYANLILESNRRYGKHIKTGICNFIKSKTNKEIALFQLLSYLNRVR